MSFSAPTMPLQENLDYDYNGVGTITCLGSGFLGASLGAVLASQLPNIVYVVDQNADLIAAWNSEDLPLSEPGLYELVMPRSNAISQRCRRPNLVFLTDAAKAIRAADVIFICVNTPSKQKREVDAADLDLHHVESAVRAVAKYSTRNKIVVVKSTVPCGTAVLVQNTLHSLAADNVHLQVLSNPEFLAEGCAIEDLLHPDRIIIGHGPGSEQSAAATSLGKLYAAWIPSERIVLMNHISAELTKLASNALLAQRISAANALSALCEKIGADVGQVTQACGLDPRIGPHMLKAGPGFGGGCLAKDVSALIHLAGSQKLPEVAQFWQQTLEINDYQKRRIVDLIGVHLGGNTSGHRVAILGFAYKENVNDCRNSPAIDLVQSLANLGASVAIYDPHIPAKQIADALSIPVASERIDVCETLYLACAGAEAVVLLTDWKESGGVDWKLVAKYMEEPKVLYDARNVLDHKALEAAGLWVEVVGKTSARSLPALCRSWY